MSAASGRTMNNKLFGNRNNPTGKGGFGQRPKDRYRIGEPGFACCGARTKRAGTPCRNPPLRGRKRCLLHGGTGGRGKWTLPKSLRQIHNKAVKTVRQASRVELAGRSLHPDTMKALRAYSAELYEPNEAAFLLALDARITGEMPPDEFRMALKAARERR